MMTINFRTGHRRFTALKTMARGMLPDPRGMFELLGKRTGTYVAAIATIAVGCGGTSKPPEVPPDAPTVDAPGAVDAPVTVDAPVAIDAPTTDAPVEMIVRGTATLHHVTDIGVVERPEDLRGVTFASFTPTASGFERRTGEGAADGTFAVPVGIGAPAWLFEFGITRNGSRFFLVSSAVHPDYSLFLLGRPDGRLPTRPTSVTINATGLSPWQSFDEIGIMSPNVGALVPEAQTTTSPALGDTAITGHVIPWREELIEAVKGDTTMMFQLVAKPQTAFPGTYVALAKSGVANGFTMVNGSPATMTVALADVPQSGALTVHVKRSQFDALRAQVGPGALAAEIFQQSLFIHALPQVRQRGLFGPAPNLVVSFPAGGTLDYDETFSYGNPFTTGGVVWEEFAAARYNFFVPVLAAGATTPSNVQVGFTAEIPISALAIDGTIAPALTPVRNVKIAGLNLATPRTGVGLTPTITWDPPSTGTPTSYLVELRRVIANGPATAVQPIAVFSTTSPSLQLPDSVLSSGASYILVMTVNTEPGYDHAAPFMTGMLSNFVATSATAQFTP